MIGMFDSGLGGLSVWRAVQALLPQESIRYYADSGNCPYGPRPEAEIQVLSERIVNELTGKGCDIIVIACNTATSAAIQWLRARHPETCFVGIEPAIKPAAQATRSGVIGILATQGTFRGGHFTRTRQAWASHVEVL
ncbi:MAG: glutamate racemase, partial [Bacteroidetes bacterium]